MDASKYSCYFPSELLAQVQGEIAKLNDRYHRSLEGLKKEVPLDKKYVLRALRRAACNPTLAAKLHDKKHRLDADTIDILNLDSGAVPTAEMIKQRITVIENSRRSHGLELARYHCGHLRMVYEARANPRDVRLLRKFVVEALTEILDDSEIPDPNQHPDRLDDWINTSVESLNPAIHSDAAMYFLQAAAKQPEKN